MQYSKHAAARFLHTSTILSTKPRVCRAVFDAWRIRGLINICTAITLRHINYTLIQLYTIHIDPELDSPITLEEINYVITSCLKNNKSSGLDMPIPELFKTNKDVLSPIIQKLFNKIFSSGVYPKSWGEGVIVPIYKGKGDTSDANN